MSEKINYQQLDEYKAFKASSQVSESTTRQKQVDAYYQDQFGDVVKDNFNYKLDSYEKELASLLNPKVETDETKVLALQKKLSADYLELAREVVAVDRQRRRQILHRQVFKRGQEKKQTPASLSPTEELEAKNTSVVMNASSSLSEEEKTLLFRDYQRFYDLNNKYIQLRQLQTAYEHLLVQINKHLESEKWQFASVAEEVPNVESIKSRSDNKSETGEPAKTELNAMQELEKGQAQLVTSETSMSQINANSVDGTVEEEDGSTEKKGEIKKVSLSEKFLKEMNKGEKISLAELQEFKFLDLEPFLKDIIKISNSWNPVEIYTASNHQSEKDKFLQSWREKGQAENPQFTYDLTHLDFSKQKMALLAIRKEVMTLAKQIKEEGLETQESRLKYLSCMLTILKINDDLTTADILAGIKTKNDEKTQTAVKRKYGSLDKKLIEKAREIYHHNLNEGDKNKSEVAILSSAEQKWLLEQEFEAEDIKAYFSWALKEYGLLAEKKGDFGFMVEIDDQATSIDVRDKNQDKQPKIVIPKNKKINGKQLLSLVGHEIEAHARQSMNGAKLFTFGGGNLKIDGEAPYEGLAKQADIKFEKEYFGLEDAMPSPYYILAMEMAQNGQTFKEVFAEILELKLKKSQIDQSQPEKYQKEYEKMLASAWIITYRVFRGSTDPENKSNYAMLKDKAYLEGFLFSQDLENLGHDEYNQLAITTGAGTRMLALLEINKDDIPYPYLNIQAKLWQEKLKPLFEQEKQNKPEKDDKNQDKSKKTELTGSDNNDQEKIDYQEVLEKTQAQTESEKKEVWLKGEELAINADNQKDGQGDTAQIEAQTATPPKEIEVWQKNSAYQDYLIYRQVQTLSAELQSLKTDADEKVGKFLPPIEERKEFLQQEIKNLQKTKNYQDVLLSLQIKAWQEELKYLDHEDQNFFQDAKEINDKIATLLPQLTHADLPQLMAKLPELEEEVARSMISSQTNEQTTPLPKKLFNQDNQETDLVYVEKKQADLKQLQKKLEIAKQIQIEQDKLDKIKNTSLYQKYFAGEKEWQEVEKLNKRLQSLQDKFRDNKKEIKAVEKRIKTLEKSKNYKRYQTTTNLLWRIMSLKNELKSIEVGRERFLPAIKERYQFLPQEIKRLQLALPKPRLVEYQEYAWRSIDQHQQILAEIMKKNIDFNLDLEEDEESIPRLEKEIANLKNELASNRHLLFNQEGVRDAEK